MSDQPAATGPADDGRSDLFVSGDGLSRRRLRVTDSPVTFGRAHDVDLRICGPRETAVSRHAGSLLWHDGLWYVRNESRTRPFYVVVDRTSFARPPLRRGDAPATWAISPPGLTLQFVTPVATIEVEVATVRHGPDPSPLPDPDTEYPTTPRTALSARDRQLNSAKFLSGGVDGPIVGDIEAAAIGNEHLAPDARPITGSAVMNAVSRARKALTENGVTDLGGQHNMLRLRRELLSWGLLAEQDGHWLHGDREGRA